MAKLPKKQIVTHRTFKIHVSKNATFSNKVSLPEFSNIQMFHFSKLHSFKILKFQSFKASKCQRVKVKASNLQKTTTEIEIAEYNQNCWISNIKSLKKWSTYFQKYNKDLNTLRFQKILSSKMT